jgi:L-rhamnose isomerase/sugar isomerase
MEAFMAETIPAYEVLANRLTQQGVDIEPIKKKLSELHIETPSWGYGNSGTRFKVFPWPGAARNAWEKLADAAYIHRLSGIAPSVALHIPWDKVDDWPALSAYAADLGVAIGAINPNVFQDEIYKLGSLCHPSGAVRETAITHMIECCEIIEQTRSDILSIWLADGTNYAGQDNIRARKQRLYESLKAVYPHLPRGARMLIEYKFYEPAFYHTDLADWGMAYAMARRLGDQAQVLVDTGHHAMGTNVAHIVAFLLDEKKLGGFHLNARHYGDDDLIVGSDNAWEVFLIFNELVDSGAQADHVAYMIDQSHNIEPKLEAMLVSVLNCQLAYAKALIVDRGSLQEAQLAGDVLGAHGILMDAFQTDVRPLLKQVRVEAGLPADPVAVLRADNYQEQIARERGTDTPSGGGYPG